MDPPANEWSTILLTVTSYLGVAVLGGVIAALVYFTSRGDRRLLPLQRLRWGCWSGSEVVLSIMIWAGASVLAATLLQESNWYRWFYGDNPSPLRKSLWVTPLYLPLFLALMFTGFYLISRTYPQDLGVSPCRWRANIIVGYLGFVVATPVVLGLYGLLSSLKDDNRSHQLLELVGQGVSPLEWLLVVFMVCMAAPIMEEVIFRGVVQGWLRRAPLAGHVTLLMLICGWSLWSSLKFNDAKNAQNIVELFESLEGINWSRMVGTAALGAIYVLLLRRCERANLFLTEADFLPPESSEPERTDEGAENVAAEQTSQAGSVGQAFQPAAASDKLADLRHTHWLAQDVAQQRRKTWLAIYGASMAWALVHSTWPDPMALMLLGLVHGWLTHRTQNLLPAIVSHSFFNLVACVLLFRGGD